MKPAHRLLLACLHSLRRRIILFFFIPALAAQGGVVQTLDGHTWKGALQLKAGGWLQVALSNQPPINVTLSNLLRANFTSSAGDDTAVPALSAAVLEENNGVLPSPWRSRDIGRVERNGNATHLHGTFTLAGGHRAERKGGDGFRFVYQSFRGNGEIVARVASIEPRDEKDRQARAGVLIRASLDAEALSVFMAVSGGLGTYFRKWGNATEFPAHDRGAAYNPPYWVKLVREGNRFSGYQSTDGEAWRLLAETTAPMPQRVFVGLAMINTRKGETARASFDHVRVGTAAPAGSFMAKVILRDGTIIADPFKSVDDARVTFSDDKKNLAVRTADVTCLVFQEIEAGQKARLERTGVLLRNGDFIDGEFRGLADGRVKISSVLFGNRSYEIKNKVVAIYLGSVTPQPAAFHLKTLEGSVWRADSIVIEAGAVRLMTPWAGPWRVPAEELLEIRQDALMTTAAGAPTDSP